MSCNVLVLMSDNVEIIDCYGAEKCIEILNMNPSIRASKIDIKHLQNLSLEIADVLIIAGGEPYQIRVQMEGKGANAIRKFISDGGGYIGICAGAVLAIPKSPSLDLLQHVKTVNDNIWWESGICGDIKLSSVFEDSNEELSTICSRFTSENSFSYKNGPLFKIKCPKRKSSTAPIPLATFVGPLFNTCDNIPQNLMNEIDSSIAIIFGTYGNGSIIISSIHPEYDTKFSNSELLHEMCFSVMAKN